MILKEASRPITLNDAKGPVTLTMFEMAYRGLGFQAGKGSVRAQRDYVDLKRRGSSGLIPFSWQRSSSVAGPATVCCDTLPTRAYAKMRTLRKPSEYRLLGL